MPLLDDILREKVLQILVSRTLKAHGRTYASVRVKPLYGGDGSRLEGCLIFLVLLPLKLLIYPIRKIYTWIMAVKYLAGDLAEAVLLGRTLDRLLGEGRLAEGAAPRALEEESARIRRAFSNAIAGTDLRILRSVLTSAVRSVSGLPRAALHALRTVRGKREDADPMEGVSSGDKAIVEEGAASVGRALETPEMRAFMERFDQRFDENLRTLEARVRA